MSVLEILFCLLLIAISVLLCVGTLLLDKAEKHNFSGSMSDGMFQHSGNLAKGSIEKLIIAFTAVLLILSIAAMIAAAISV